MKIEKIFENDDFIVVNKPSGISIHHGIGENENTLVDWFIDNHSEIKKLDWPDISRPGIIHRLDKDTSGLLLLTKNPQTLEDFQKKFQNHEIQKTYLALVLGPVNPKYGEIITKISRSGKDFRLKTTRTFNLDESAKTAISQFKVIKNYGFKAYRLSLIAVRIITGRTHQIRTQMKYKGWPIIGDQQYNTKISKRISDKLNLHHQFLHAHKLEFCYNDKKMVFESELPEELNNIINQLT